MENLQENPRFNGKIYGFRLKDFPNKTNPLNISPIYLAVNVCIDVLKTYTLRVCFDRFQEN